MFVQAEDETESAVRTWGKQHTALWEALLATGRAVEVVAVGRDPVRLAATERVLNKWASIPPGTSVKAEEAAAELESIRRAIAAGDWVALEVYGGLNPALQRTIVLGAVPGLLDGVLVAAADEAVGQRRVGPADEGEVLGAEEHAAVPAFSDPSDRFTTLLASGNYPESNWSSKLFRMSASSDTKNSSW